MRKGIILLISCILLTGRALAAETVLPRELLEAAPEAAELTGKGREGFDLASAISALWERNRKENGLLLRSGARSTASIMAGVLLLGVAETLATDPRNLTGRYTAAAGTLWITAVSAGDMEALIGLGRDTVGEIAAFSKVLLPALAATTAASGSVTAASVKQVATVFFSDLLLTVIDSFLLPMVYLYIGTAAAGAILDGDTMDSIGKLLKKGIVWCLTGLLTAFTTYLTISGAIAGSVDQQTLRAAKATVSGVVPVVGGILADAAETVLAGAGVLRGMIGSFGVVAILSICLSPFLRLLIQYVLYQAAGILAETAGPKNLAKLIARLGDAFGLVLAMTASSALAIIISLMAALTGVSA